jgi:hypothetical protein
LRTSITTALFIDCRHNSAQIALAANPQKAYNEGERGRKMSAIPFDTHYFVKRLVTAGMPEAQAEVIAEEQAKLIENQLATKTDLDLLKNELTIRIGGMLVALAGFLAAVKFFAPH